MPFEDGAFDRAMMLHVGMNIADKAGLLEEVARVLVAGVFGIYDMMQVGEGTVSFPMPWASTADVLRVAHHKTISQPPMRPATLVSQHDETSAAEGFFKHVRRPSRRQNPARHRTLSAISPRISKRHAAPMELILAKDGLYGPQDRHCRHRRHGVGLCGAVEAGHEIWAVDGWQDHVDAITSKGLRLSGASGDRTITSIRAATDLGGVEFATFISSPLYARR